MIESQGNGVMRGSKVSSAPLEEEKEKEEEEEAMVVERVQWSRLMVLLSSSELVLALLVLVLNVIFIYFGQNSGWYSFVDRYGVVW